LSVSRGPVENLQNTIQIVASIYEQAVTVGMLVQHEISS